MKQQKNEIGLKIDEKQEVHEGVNLRSEFNKLSANEQQAISHYFNLHNAAGYLYSTLSDAAKEYTDLCIKFSLEQIEQQKSE